MTIIDLMDFATELIEAIDKTFNQPEEKEEECNSSANEQSQESTAS